MPNPQQQELARSGRSQVSANDTATGSSAVPPSKERSSRTTGVGPVPPDNRPGHQPDHPQDKPLVPPEAYRVPASKPKPKTKAAAGAAKSTAEQAVKSKTGPKAKAKPKAGGPAKPKAGKPAAESASAPKAMADAAPESGETKLTVVPSPPGPARHPFLFEPLMMPFSLAVGVTPPTAWVSTDDDRIEIRFGPWVLSTPRSNVASATVTGPYHLLKVVGPPHLSFADRGITFATNRKQGTCITFHEPVAALVPGEMLRHPAATVTVADPHQLARLLDPSNT